MYKRKKMKDGSGPVRYAHSACMLAAPFLIAAIPVLVLLTFAGSICVLTADNGIDDCRDDTPYNAIHHAYAQQASLRQSDDGDGTILEFHTNSKVYAPSHKLQVYGTALPEETIIVRLFAPDGSITKFDQITTEPDGSFNYDLLIWPHPSTQFSYGTYAVEVISTAQNGASRVIDVRFSSTTELLDVPVERYVNTLVFAPETAAINQPLRVYVQTTSDGLLIGNDPAELLANTHVHLPSGEYVPLADSFGTLHQGLYFVEYVPTEEGTHVFHVVAFSQGTSSHGSAATTVLRQDLGGISEQIITLNAILDETAQELDILKSDIEGFDSTLDDASAKIDKSTEIISTSVTFVSEASSQLNSLLFPIIASIGIIVALQIAILARRR